jgi:hypothetical protein
MQSKGSRIESRAGGLPEERLRAHLVGPPSVEEFHAAITRYRTAALSTRLALKRAAAPQGTIDAPIGLQAASRGIQAEEEHAHG